MPEAALEYEVDRAAVEDSLQCVHLLKEMYEYYYEAEVRDFSSAWFSVLIHPTASQNDIHDK